MTTIISVIVGSTRQGRFSEKPAQWILQHLQKRDDIEARLLDLRDFPIPFFDQPVLEKPGRKTGKNRGQTGRLLLWFPNVGNVPCFPMFPANSTRSGAPTPLNRKGESKPEWEHKMATRCCNTRQLWQKRRRYKREQIKDNANQHQRSACSQKDEERDWVVPSQSESLDQQPNQNDRACNSQPRFHVDSLNHHFGLQYFAALSFAVL